jgi:hypothetical protein
MNIHNAVLIPDNMYSIHLYRMLQIIYSQLHCSENLYKDLVQKEKEKKQNKKNDGKPKLHLFFPQK